MIDHHIVVRLEGQADTLKVVTDCDHLILRSQFATSSWKFNGDIQHS